MTINDVVRPRSLLTNNFCVFEQHEGKKNEWAERLGRVEVSEEVAVPEIVAGF